MYTSINVHIENGVVILDEPIALNTNAKGILTIIEEPIHNSNSDLPILNNIKTVLGKLRETNPFKDIENPSEWQRTTRKDRDMY